MARGTAIAVILAAVSCVPSAADPHPRGGFSVRFTPSAATAGQPFTTADGWMLRIKKTALYVHALAQSGNFKSTPPTIAGSALDSRLISATEDCELVLRALDVGDAVVKAALEVDGSDPPRPRPAMSIPKWQLGSRARPTAKPARPSARPTVRSRTSP
jgi:hypothetical protein